MLSEPELERELLIMTDRFTDQLFFCDDSDATSVRFPVSRLILDPERYVQDDLEPMAERGMGVVYTRCADGRPLRLPPTPSGRQELIEEFYLPHHRALTTAVQEAVDHCGICLLLDCHSYPEEAIPCDLDPSSDRPDICLGTSAVHTPDWLAQCARDSFENEGFEVAMDRPYAGVLVPTDHGRPDTSVCALMIEVNRRLYMNERNGDKLPEFGQTQAVVRRVIRSLTTTVEQRVTHS